MKHIFMIGSLRTPLVVKVRQRGNNYLAEVWIGENSVDAKIIVAQSDEAMREIAVQIHEKWVRILAPVVEQAFADGCEYQSTVRI